MIDHVVIKTTAALFAQTVELYEAALAPLGFTKLRQIGENAAGFGAQKPEFWIFVASEAHSAHVAFRADNRDIVRQFHEAAIKAGAKDNGAPGLREKIAPTYYAAFFHDPSGNNIEACCFNPGE